MRGTSRCDEPIFRITVLFSAITGRWGQRPLQRNQCKTEGAMFSVPRKDMLIQ